jgi:hypothetical protein
VVPSSWLAERNAKSLARLQRSLPSVFPVPVLNHALAQRMVPPTPRLAVECYWRHHPFRADRLARALAHLSGAPEGWTWRVDGEKAGGLPSNFRCPPAPYREAAYAKDAGNCCVCGQSVFRFGWHRDMWGDGRPNTKANWHACCVAAWKLWVAPNAHLRSLKRRQQHRCSETGGRLVKVAEVDHRQPLFQVWNHRLICPWPKLLDYWGAPNLQVINPPAHLEKSAREAAERARTRRHRTVDGSGTVPLAAPLPE